MKIGFLLLRDTYLKTMGSLMEASLNRDHQVMILYTEAPIRGNKAYQRITTEKLAPISPKGVEAVPFLLKDLGKVKEKFQLDALVTLEGYYMMNSYLAEIQVARKKGVKVVSLAHFFENIMRLPESLDYFDKTYYLSQFAVDAHFMLYGDGSAERTRKGCRGQQEAIGSPMFDQLIDVDQEEARAEFGIPADKRVVLFFAPAINADTRWRFRMWGNESKIKRIRRAVMEGNWRELPDAFLVPTLEEIVDELKEFCERNNALLVIKSRAKQQDAAYFKDKADLYLSGEEDSYYPVFTSYKLLAIADVCIGVMSMSVAEAVAMRVPVWNIYVPSSELNYPINPLYPRQRQYLQMIMGREQMGPFNYPGVITNIEPRNVLKWLRENKLEEAIIDPKAAAKYVEKYLGITNEPSSERILDSLEQMHASAIGRKPPIER